MSGTSSWDVQISPWMHPDLLQDGSCQVAPGLLHRYGFAGEAVDSKTGMDVAQ
jgi:hypothetical protein